MIDIKIQTERLAEKLAFSKAQTAKVMAVTVSDAAYKIRDVLREEMQKNFDRPTPFVLNSIFVKKAQISGDRILPAVVGIKGVDSKLKVTPSHVLLAEVRGGTRAMKRSEILLKKFAPKGMPHLSPGAGAPLDAYGNVPGAYLQKVFSALQAQFDTRANSLIEGTSGLRRKELQKAAKIERLTGGAQFGKNGRIKKGLRGYGNEAQAYLLERIAQQDKHGKQMGANFFLGPANKTTDPSKTKKVIYEFDWVQRPGKKRPNNPNPSPVLTKTNVRPVLVFTKAETYKVRLPMLKIANDFMSSPALQKLLDHNAMRLFTKWNTR